MHHKDQKQVWDAYTQHELVVAIPLLLTLGFSLDGKQPHLQGERYAMQAITTTHGKKLILLGTRVKDGTRVVIKITNDPAGIKEIEHERLCRETLKTINFAYQVFFSPEELLFTHAQGYVVSIQAFLVQEKPFLERPIEEQFNLALSSFKAQESAHATTYKHYRRVVQAFGAMDAKGYLALFSQFARNIRGALPQENSLHFLMAKAEEFLQLHTNTIEQYCGFLTHTDFVPHNFRVIDGHIYLLDHSSLRFGNKYEGWARFLNFMTLYNRPLEAALLSYVRDNRTPEELESLWLMRIFRLGEILWYYTNLLTKTSGDLHVLTQKRIEFWTQVLQAALEQRVVSDTVVAEYQKIRDSLRSPEEKERQQGLH